MKVEHGFQPNCSEVVYHISDMSKEEILNVLEQHGIEKVSMKGFYSFSPEDEIEMLSDTDNPNLPDFRYNAYLKIEEGYAGCGTYEGGACVVGHQHCQRQLFPTMHKIEQLIPTSEWSGDDGGNIEEYEEWVEKGAHQIEPFQDEIEIPIGNLDRRNLETLIEYAKTLGLESHEEVAGPYGKLLRFDPPPYFQTSLNPHDVKSKRMYRAISEVRNQLDNKFRKLLAEQKR